MPGNVLVLQQAAWLAAYLNRDEEAISLAQRAVEQDPLSASAYFVLQDVMWAAGRSEEAVAAAKMSLQLAPGKAMSHMAVSRGLLALGRIDEALDEAMLETHEVSRLTMLAIIHHGAGRRADSDQALLKLASEHADLGAYQVAQVHAMRAENDLAFEWLERARTQRDPGIVLAKGDLCLRPLHNDPRWDPFLRKIGRQTESTNQL